MTWGRGRGSSHPPPRSTHIEVDNPLVCQGEWPSHGSARVRRHHEDVAGYEIVVACVMKQPLPLPFRSHMQKHIVPQSRSLGAFIGTWFSEVGDHQANIQTRPFHFHRTSAWNSPETAVITWVTTSARIVDRVDSLSSISSVQILLLLRLLSNAVLTDLVRHSAWPLPSFEEFGTSKVERGKAARASEMTHPFARTNGSSYSVPHPPKKKNDKQTSRVNPGASCVLQNLAR